MDPGSYYFRTAPGFHAPPGKYEWLNRSLFLASGQRARAGITLKVWSVT